MQLKCGLMRKHAGLLGPEPKWHELVLLSVGKVPETIDAPTDPVNTAPTVVIQKLGGETGCERVSQHEVSALRCSGFIQGVPAWRVAIGLRARHTQTLKPILYLCASLAFWRR
ncbi:hypothetical protein D3C78_1607340 [compost metagenome]